MRHLIQLCQIKDKLGSKGVSGKIFEFGNYLCSSIYDNSEGINYPAGIIRSVQQDYLSHKIFTALYEVKEVL